MKVSTFFTAALVSPLAYAAPTELVERQTKARELIRADFYPTLQRYTKFGAASMATFIYGMGTCKKPPFKSTLVRKVSNIFTDTQVAFFQDDAAGEFILSFPGSSSPQDFGTDINVMAMSFTTAPGCSGCKVHGGVLMGWNSIRSQVKQAIVDLQAKKPTYDTILVGHSLGGGLASIAFTDLKANGVRIEAAYTMGSLCVGNKAYADFTDKLAGASDTSLGSLIRITHATDGVPSLPSNNMGFQHTRSEIFEANDSNGKPSASTTYRCYGQEATDCNKGTASGFINQDHLSYTGIDMTNGDMCNSSD